MLSCRDILTGAENCRLWPGSEAEQPVVERAEHALRDAKLPRPVAIPASTAPCNAFREILLKNPYGAAADQWSLGCILYSFLVGRPPFESAEVKSTFEKVSRAQYYLPVWLSAAVKDLLSRLIVHDPDQRLSSSQVLQHPFFKKQPSAPEAAPGNVITRRLRPIRQHTKHGIIELLPTGHIWVDFMVDPTITLIAPDGVKVQCFQKGTLQSAISSARPVETLIYPNLPMPKQKIYEYARKFVVLLRSKTPRVIISSAKFKAFLMDNGPPSDFLVKYNDGQLRSEYSAETENLRLFSGDRLLACIKSPSTCDLDDLSLDSEMRLMVSEFLGRYQQAAETSQRIRKEQESGIIPFPFVVREHTTPESGQTAFCQPTVQLMTISEAAPPLRRAAPQAAPQQVPTAESSDPGNFVWAYKTFLPNVGWCLASTCDQFLMLYADGVSALVDGRANVVGIHDLHGRAARWYRIDGALPDVAKRKLAHFPRFIQMLKQGHGHSFVT